MILRFTGTSSRLVTGGRIGWKKRSRTTCVVAEVSLPRLLQTHGSRAKRKTFANCGSSTGKPNPTKRPPRRCSYSFHPDWLEPFPDRLAWCEDWLCRFTFKPLEDTQLGGCQALPRRVLVTSPAVCRTEAGKRSLRLGDKPSFGQGGYEVPARVSFSRPLSYRNHRRCHDVAGRRRDYQE